MIQRIQTLYLLIATALCATMYFYPLAEIFSFSESNVLKLIHLDVIGYRDTLSGEIIQFAWPVMILSGLIVLFNLIAVFLFKKRTSQARIVTYNCILMIALVGLVFFYGSYLVDFLHPEEVMFKFPITFIPIAAVLNFMAYKGIIKDEKLIKSLDRIR